MNTVWKLPQLKLDVSPLWRSSGGLQLPSDAPSKLTEAWNALITKCKSGNLGFFDWPDSSECAHTLEQVHKLATSLRGTYEGALCIGIGGSYLGPAALQDIFLGTPSKEGFAVHWVSNVDSAAIKKAEHFLSSRKCAVVIISKSGGTTETLAAWFYLSHLFRNEDIVVITDPREGELRRLSNSLGWKSLSVPSNIGGRFSVLTSVGLFPLALQNIAVHELIQGASLMNKALMSFTADENPAALYAYSKYLWDISGCSIDYFMPYDSRLKSLAEWYVQLWAESLGKKQITTQKAVGPNPVAALGTSDQHSLLQLFKEGPRKRVIGFLTALEADSPQIGKPNFDSPQYSFLSRHTFNQLNILASEATQESLINAEVPTYRFELSDLTPKTLGAFLQFQETACGLAGELYQVNAFDQPGVEESKKILRRKLDSETPSSML
ncbi:hypothetical protein EBR78_05125 [bacterium]|nr:hypothetical protein [bacterium]NBX82327.1 hypothetical protein [bacterium]